MTKMTSCRAYGAMISDSAAACPQCGAMFKRTLVAPLGIASMLTIALVYAVLKRDSG
jgi:hypothetical protein